MNKETVVVTPQKKREVQFKPRFELIKPADVVELNKLFVAGIKASPWTYPSLDEHVPAEFAQWLYYMITQPQHIGMMARLGRKSVGYIFGHFMVRPIGKPQQYVLIVSAWVEPQASEVASDLKKAFLSAAKARGFHHWEANPADTFLKGFMGSETHGKIDLNQGV